MRDTALCLGAALTLAVTLLSLALSAAAEVRPARTEELAGEQQHQQFVAGDKAVVGVNWFVCPRARDE